MLTAMNIPKSGKNNISSYPSFYEDTHIEIIEAQKRMSDYGLKSAIFVSSPHHMRRIKLIAEKVFKSNNYNFYYVPTRYENISVNCLGIVFVRLEKNQKRVQQDNLVFYVLLLVGIYGIQLKNKYFLAVNDLHIKTPLTHSCVKGVKTILQIMKMVLFIKRPFFSRRLPDKASSCKETDPG